MQEAPPPCSPPGLALTGERTLPGIAHENYWFQRHVVAYRLAGRAAGGRSILDAGCGEGYGLALLARAGAARVVGADLDERVIDHVRTAYAPRYRSIEAVACELMALPLADDEVDLTVSFQVIEHLHDIPGYLASLRRVTRPGGTLVVSTPNRLTFTPGSAVPTNPFHTREFAPWELVAELERAGLVVRRLVGVHHGAALRAAERLLGRPLTDVLAAREVGAWPWWLRTLVAAVRPGWFRLVRNDLEHSLDLVAICGVPPR